MVKRSIVCIGLVLSIVGPPVAALGATTPMKTAVVSEAGVALSYPARWLSVPYTKKADFKTMLEFARMQDRHVTARQVHRMVDQANAVDASFFAMERRSGDNVLVVVRDDDFDDAFDVSNVAQLEDELQQEFTQNGLKLDGHVEETSFGSHVAYRWSTVFSGTRTTDLFLAQPHTNATVAVAVTTDNNAKSRRVADSILDSVEPRG